MTRQAMYDGGAAAAAARGRSELASLIDRLAESEGVNATAFPPLALFRSSVPTEPTHAFYEPAVCLIAQGRKRVMLGGEVLTYDAENYLLVSADLPVVGQVVDATERVPYLGLRLDLDPAVIGALALEAAGPEPADEGTRRGLAVSRLDAPLLDAVLRLLRLLDEPRDVPVLAPLVVSEIVYRLLRGEHGSRLRQIATGNGAAKRVGKAIELLRRGYAEPLRVEDLARAANMSASALHHHFKSVTAMSPLQYQKRLRLLPSSAAEGTSPPSRALRRPSRRLSSSVSNRESHSACPEPCNWDSARCARAR